MSKQMAAILAYEDSFREAGIRTRGQVDLASGHVLFFGKLPANARETKSGRWGIALEVSGCLVRFDDAPVELQNEAVKRLDDLSVAVDQAQEDLLIAMRKTNARLKNWMAVVFQDDIDGQLTTTEEVGVINDEWIHGELTEEQKEEGWDRE